MPPDTITRKPMHSLRASPPAWQAGLLLALTLLCTSCLYSRLLTFKDQLASFDDFVALTNRGCTLEFRKPVVRAGDLTELTGFAPSRIDLTPDGRQLHTYRYRSLTPVGVTGTPQTLTFTLRFTTNGLIAFDFPPSVAGVLGTNFVIAASKAVGKSRLLQRQSQLDWTGTNHPGSLIPSRAAIASILGPPQTGPGTLPGTDASYRYLLETSNGTTQAGAPLSADLRFDPATTLMTNGLIHVGKLKLAVQFPAAP